MCPLEQQGLLVTWLLMSAVPGVDVEVVGGPCVLKVMDGCSKNHGKDL